MVKPKTPKLPKEANICNCCLSEFNPIARILTLTDGEGVVLDVVRFCDDCWDDREIFISDKSISY